MVLNHVDVSTLGHGMHLPKLQGQGPENLSYTSGRELERCATEMTRGR